MKTILTIFILFICSCNSSENAYDASGIFEADEVLVSSEVSGKINSMYIREGDKVKKGDTIAVIDTRTLELQREQVLASVDALNDKTIDVSPQIKMLKEQLSVQQIQMNTLIRERSRIENLYKADAATKKQLDDIVSQIDQLNGQMKVTEQQILVQKELTGTQNRSILSEKQPLAKRIAQLDDQISRSFVLNPINGNILVKYALQGELVNTGKALYKVADLSVLRLKAYISGNQLPIIKLGQTVKVLVDDGKGGFKNYNGKITWIADKPEFTPKTIQTKEERVNLVYAIKADVINDGLIKLGMYGEIKF